MSVEIICGDARSALAGMPEQSVHAVVTSPPYWHQRDYGCNGQIGLESTPTEYIAALVDVFSAVHRVLRDDGTCWIVIGDSYAGSWGNHGRKAERGTQRPISGPMLQQCDARYPSEEHNTGAVPAGLKPKDLMMIPHRMAIALQDEGWYVRNDCVWAKGAAMPESVQDRFSRAHEYVFHLAKSERYYFDALAVSEPCMKGASGSTFTGGKTGVNGQGRVSQAPRIERALRNRRSVLHINPQPFSAADFGVKDTDHYAVFPEKLVEICLLAGTSEAGCCAQCGAPWRRVVQHGAPERMGGNAGVRIGHAAGPMDRGGHGQWDEGHMPLVRPACTVGWEPGCRCQSGVPVPCRVLDPFCGSGTTLLVAKGLGRNGVGIDLNPEYCRLAERRCASIPYPLFSAAGSSADSLDGAAR